MTSSTAPLSRRRAETRDRLIEAAVHVFAEHGVDGASVEEICEQAGFTRGAFYSNFGSKDELVVAVLRSQGSLQLAQTRQVIDQTLNDGLVAPAEGLTIEGPIAQALQLIVSTQNAEPDWLIVLRELRLYAVRRPTVAEDLIAFDEELKSELGVVIEGALRQACLEFAIPTGVAVDLMIAVWENGMMHGLLAATVDGGVVRPPHQPMVTLLSSITRSVGGA